MKKLVKKIITVILFLGVCAPAFWSLKLLIVDNPLRMLSHDFAYLEDVELYTSIDLGEKYEQDKTDRKEIGPLPDGKFVSGYYMQREGSYDDGYRQKPYSYTTDLYVYDIYDKLSFFESEDSTYRRLMGEFESKLTAYKHSRFYPTITGGKYQELHTDNRQAMSYVTQSQYGTPTIRTIFFANKKVYILEVRDGYDLYGSANEIISHITTVPLHQYDSLGIKSICAMLLTFALAFIFAIVKVRKFFKLPTLNMSAKKMCIYTICMSIMNILIVLYLFWKLYYTGNYRLFVSYNYYYDLRTFLCLTMATLVIMDLLICTYLYIKSKEKYRYDYPISDKVSSYLGSRLDGEKEKKTLLLLLYYPVFLVGVIPLGISILVYAIPFALITLIVLQTRCLYRWINKDSIIVDDERNRFLDYYVILDLRTDATKDDIDRAFNSAMAKYNSATGNPLYGKQFYNEVQEAYAILSSTNQLRPEYDKEYELYKSEASVTYHCKNKQLDNAIMNIRHRLNGVKPVQKKRKINIIIVSFIILLIAAFTTLRLTGVIPPLFEDKYGRSWWSASVLPFIKEITSTENHNKRNHRGSGSRASLRGEMGGAMGGSINDDIEDDADYEYSYSYDDDDELDDY